MSEPHKNVLRLKNWLDLGQSKVSLCNKVATNVLKWNNINISLRNPRALLY